jgi:hypothetical protein
MGSVLQQVRGGVLWPWRSCILTHTAAATRLPTAYKCLQATGRSSCSNSSSSIGLRTNHCLNNSLHLLWGLLMLCACCVPLSAACRTAASDVRLALFNATMVLPQESEMAYVTYMFTMYTSALPYLRRQTSFYSDVLHMTILQVRHLRTRLPSAYKCRLAHTSRQCSSAC